MFTDMEKWAEIRRRVLNDEISKRAAGDKAKVFGSIGPSGKIVMTGEVKADERAPGNVDDQVVACDPGVEDLFELGCALGFGRKKESFDVVTFEVVAQDAKSPGWIFSFQSVGQVKNFFEAGFPDDEFEAIAGSLRRDDPQVPCAWSAPAAMEVIHQ